MADIGASNPFCIIGSEMKFTERFGEYIQSATSGKLGKYKVISVMGTQGTGKSSLLNKIFGTEFYVNPERLGERTTKGIWMQKAGNGDQLFVVDCEGMDSTSRSEDHISFDVKASLFLLGVSDLLVLNVWTNDIGRYEATSLGILQHVFSRELAIRKKEKDSEGSSERPVNVLVVARDVQKNCNREKLKENLLKNIAHVFDNAKQNKELRGAFSNAQLGDIFSIRVEFLHKLKPNSDKNKATFEGIHGHIKSIEPRKKVMVTKMDEYFRKCWNAVMRGEIVFRSTLREIGLSEIRSVRNSEGESFAEAVKKALSEEEDIYDLCFGLIKETMSNFEQCVEFHFEGEEYTKLVRDYSDECSIRYMETVVQISKRRSIEKIDNLHIPADSYAGGNIHEEFVERIQNHYGKFPREYLAGGLGEYVDGALREANNDFGRIHAEKIMLYYEGTRTKENVRKKTSIAFDDSAGNMWDAAVQELRILVEYLDNNILQGLPPSTPVDHRREFITKEMLDTFISTCVDSVSERVDDKMLEVFRSEINKVTWYDYLRWNDGLSKRYSAALENAFKVFEHFDEVKPVDEREFLTILLSRVSAEENVLRGLIKDKEGRLEKFKERTEATYDEYRNLYNISLSTIAVLILSVIALFLGGNTHPKAISIILGSSGLYLVGASSFLLRALRAALRIDRVKSSPE